MKVTQARAVNPQSPQWVVRVGCAVEAIDGHAGTVAHVIMSPRRGALTHLVVRAGRLLYHDVVVDFGAIAAADPATVRLRLSLAELNDQPEFRPGDYLGPHPVYVPQEASPETAALLPQAPAATWWEPDGLPEITADTRVESRSGYAGQAVRFVVDEGTGMVRTLFVRTPGLRAHDRLVPVDWITEADSDTLFVDAEQAQLDQLPELRPDDEVRRNVADALAGDEVLRERPAWAWRVRVQDGMVTLGGYARSLTERERAVDAVRRAPGVVAVRDDLVQDDDLADQVAEALAGHAATREYHPEVAAFLGLVTLTGTVPTAAARRAVAEIAATVPGVRSVVDDIAAPGTVDGAPPVCAPIGSLVYTADGRRGYLTQVVLDPGSRRVSALVVAEDPDWDGSAEEARAARDGAERLVVPVEAVQQVTDAVLLRWDAAALDALPLFQEADFARPASAWQPPCDYQPDDVRLPRGPNTHQA